MIGKCVEEGNDSDSPQIKKNAHFTAMPYNVPFTVLPSVRQGGREPMYNVTGNEVAYQGRLIQNSTAEVGGRISYINKWIVATNSLALRSTVVGESELGNRR